MDWKSVGNIVGRSAPILGTLLGGPAGAAIGGLVGTLLGTEASPDAIHQAIAADPNKALELAKYELEHKADLQRMQLQHVQSMFASEVADRDSARRREVDTKDWTPRILAGLVVGCWLGAQWYILNTIVDQSMREMVMRALGTIDAALMLILSYYFGSTNSSARKTELLAQAGVDAQKS